MRVEQIGLATMYLGDNREIVPTLADIACVVTSPPYNQLEGLKGKPSGLWADKKGGAGFVEFWQENGYADGMMFNARMFCRFDERILWFVRGREWKWNQDQVGLGTVWRIAKAQNKTHPVAFPVEMPLRCIMATTDHGDIVLDPYSGSASTGVAAVQNGRRYIGIEREEKYFTDACRRIEDAQRQSDMFIGAAA